MAADPIEEFHFLLIIKYWNIYDCMLYKIKSEDLQVLEC